VNGFVKLLSALKLYLYGSHRMIDGPCIIKLYYVRFSLYYRFSCAFLLHKPEKYSAINMQQALNLESYKSISSKIKKK
jgi:hypothetical protein